MVLSRLERVQNWLGQYTTGVYVGIETKTKTPPWTLDDYRACATRIKAFGADYAIVKFAEDGLWYPQSQIQEIHDIFLSVGLGCAGYMFNHPGRVALDIQDARTIAAVCKGVILDCEDDFAGQDAAMAELLTGVREAVGADPVVIVSSYGDPIKRFGATGWPFHTVASADIDAYQPQWYIGVWDEYLQHGYQAAIDWGDTQCAQAFGNNFILQPAINVEGMNVADYKGLAAYLALWKASVVIWEYQQVTSEIVDGVKAGLAIAKAKFSTPPPLPQPVRSPAPVPPPILVSPPTPVKPIPRPLPPVVAIPTPALTSAEGNASVIIKPGYQTTEFWMNAVTIALSFVTALGVKLTVNNADVQAIATVAAMIASAASAIVYAHQRSTVKRAALFSAAAPSSVGAQAIQTIAKG